MLKHFIKYESLGNDFILYDWYKKPAVFVQQALKDTGWEQFVKEICDRHFGIGADGILIIKSSAETSFPEMLIFNADGSQAQMCMNGVRAAAHYLFTHHGVQKTFKIKVGQREIECSVIEDKSKGLSVEIVTNVGPVFYQENKIIQAQKDSFDGHSVDVGNPHFVIFQQTDQAWLVEHGKELESHAYFPARANIEFVWEDLTDKSHKAYRLLVYERGCGMTLACSSGVAATLGALYHLGLVKQDEQVAFNMLGGTVIGFVDAEKNIILCATATMVFSGTLEHKE